MGRGELGGVTRVGLEGVWAHLGFILTLGLMVLYEGFVGQCIVNIRCD